MSRQEKTFLSIAIMFGFSHVIHNIKGELSDAMVVFAISALMFGAFIASKPN